MSTSSRDNAPQPAYVEDAEDSQDDEQQPEDPELQPEVLPIPPPEQTQPVKVTRRNDHASDSGYSSRTQKTASSSQSSKQVKAQTPKKSGFADRIKSTLGKKTGHSSKKSSSKEAPQDTAKNLRKTPKASSNLRRQSVESRDQAARINLTGSPVQKRRNPVPAPASHPPKPQEQVLAINRPPQRPLPTTVPGHARPHTYHQGVHPSFTSHSLPSHPGYPHPSMIYGPRHPQQHTPQPMYPQPFSPFPPQSHPSQPPLQTHPQNPQPYMPHPQHYQQLPQTQPLQYGFAPQVHQQPPYETQHPYPAYTHSSPRTVLVSGGPSSPRSSGYIYAASVASSQPISQGSYFPQQHPPPATRLVAQHTGPQSTWSSYHHEPQQSRRMSFTGYLPTASDRPLVTYPTIPPPSQPPTPLSIEPPLYRSVRLSGHSMSRQSSHGGGAYHQGPPSAPHPPQADDLPFFLDDDDDYEQARIEDSRRMPPPARPPHHRSSTTSDMQRTVSYGHGNRNSLDYSQRPSLEHPRARVSSRTSHSSGSSARNINIDGPSSPSLRRRSGTSSLHIEPQAQEDAALARAESYQKTKNGHMENGITHKSVHRAIQGEQKSKHSKSRHSDTTSRTSSKSGDKKAKRSSRSHKHADDDEGITISMQDMRLNLTNGGTFMVNQEEGNFSVTLPRNQINRPSESKDRKSQRYIKSTSSKGGEVEVSRSGRSSSRAANRIVDKVKAGTSSRRSSRASRTPIEAPISHDGLTAI